MFIRIAMDTRPWSIGSFELDLQSLGAILLSLFWDKLRTVDRSDITARVHSQFVKDSVRNVVTNSENNFWRRVMELLKGWSSTRVTPVLTTPFSSWKMEWLNMLTTCKAWSQLNYQAGNRNKNCTIWPMEKTCYAIFLITTVELQLINGAFSMTPMMSTIRVYWQDV